MNRGLKIKELARELGVTSRVLMDRCREQGLDVQNSVTRLTAAEVAQARGWFAATSPAGDDPSAQSLDASRTDPR